MDQFVKEAEAHGVTSESIKGMVQRDLEYKADIYMKMRWIKIRQIATLSVNSAIFLIMGYILYRVEHNVQNIETLVKVLVATFTELNK